MATLSRSMGQAAACSVAILVYGSVSGAAPAWPAAPVSTTSPSEGGPGVATAAPPARESNQESPAAKRFRKDWILSLEGVTHAPVDMGVQLGLQTPPGIRLSGGYGWVPGAYMNLLTGVAAGASGNSYARALLEQARYTGHTWRLQAGFRPFRALGLYADVGYARVSAKGALDLASSGVPMLETLGGGYEATTKLDMWLLELGYQGQLGERVVMAFALGVMGTVNARTSITSVGGAPTNSAVLNLAASQADNALEKYGIVPTLTLRLGFDLI